MASAIPVLPDVGSRIVLSAVSSPLASAASTMASAMRSFVEPVGFWPSNLAQMRTPGEDDRRGTPTSGVSPIASRIESYRTVVDYPRGMRRRCRDRAGRTRPSDQAVDGDAPVGSPLLTLVKTPPTARVVPSVANAHTCLFGFGTQVGSTTPVAGSNAASRGW